MNEPAAGTELDLRPRPWPRVWHGIEALIAFGFAALCLVVYLVQFAPAEAEAARVSLGALDVFRSVLPVALWACVAICTLFGLWSLWTALPWSRRECLRVSDGELDWRPFVGRRRRVPCAEIVGVEDWRPPFGSPRLQLIPREGRPIRIPKALYLPPQIRALRERLAGAGSVPDPVAAEPESADADSESAPEAPEAPSPHPPQRAS